MCTAPRLARAHVSIRQEPRCHPTTAPSIAGCSATLHQALVAPAPAQTTMRKLLSTCEPCVRTSSRCPYRATCYLLGYLPTEMCTPEMCTPEMCSPECVLQNVYTRHSCIRRQVVLSLLPTFLLPPSSFRRACTKPAGAAIGVFSGALIWEVSTCICRQVFRLLLPSCRLLPTGAQEGYQRGERSGRQRQRPAGFGAAAQPWMAAAEVGDDMTRRRVASVRGGCRR